MSDKPMIAFIATYDEVADARQDYEEVKQAHGKGLIGHYDAAIIWKNDAGNVEIDSVSNEASKKWLLAGLGAGALVGLIFPPSILATSAIGALAQVALELGVKPLRLTAAIVSGDTLSAGMRRSMETFFACPCYDSYGQCEAVCMAMECAYRRMHVIAGAGIVEVLRDDGSPCHPGEVGEIVATGLLNDAMPLIRYRMGDYAAWAEDQVCACGNSQPILTDLEGRMDDYLVLRDGRRIGRLAAFKRSPTIHSAQLLQDSPDHAYLLVRPGAGYQHRDALAVCDDIRQKVGRFSLDVVEVPEIPKTARGKTALVVRLSAQPEMQPIYQRLLAGGTPRVEEAA